MVISISAPGFSVPLQLAGFREGMRSKGMVPSARRWGMVRLWVLVVAPFLLLLSAQMLFRLLSGTVISLDDAVLVPFGRQRHSVLDARTAQRQSCDERSSRVVTTARTERVAEGVARNLKAVLRTIVESAIVESDEESLGDVARSQSSVSLFCSTLCGSFFCPENRCYSVTPAPESLQGCGTTKEWGLGVRHHSRHHSPYHSRIPRPSPNNLQEIARSIDRLQSGWSRIIPPERDPLAQLAVRQRWGFNSE